MNQFPEALGALLLIYFIAGWVWCLAIWPLEDDTDVLDMTYKNKD